MTGLDLEAIRAREQAATPGPWMTVETDDGRFYGQAPTLDIWRERSDGVHETVVSGGPAEDGGPVLGACEPADAEFIAAARTAVPALLAEVDRLRDENERLQGLVPAVRAGYAASEQMRRDAQAERDAALAAVERVRKLCADAWSLQEPVLLDIAPPNDPARYAEGHANVLIRDVRAALGSEDKR